MINTWRCHVCGKEREDEDIAVSSFPLKDLLGGEINIRYCINNPSCRAIAIEFGMKGEFPSIKKKMVKIKKWWEFWK